MDYLQYSITIQDLKECRSCSFKPCYKWITFNTFSCADIINILPALVLNLVINGLPSIHESEDYAL